MKRKVGIMTWYQHHNYGTILQAAALIRVINDLGYQAEGIDYKSVGYNRECTLQKMMSTKKIISGIRTRVNSRKYVVKNDRREEKFERFIKENIPLSTKAQTSSQLYKLNTRFDAFVCGSDQIWTPAAYNSKYFLDFVDTRTKKIAYAPSFGLTSIQDENVKSLIGEQLKNMEFISVREETGKALIKDYYDIDAKVVLDPCLLLDKKAWCSMLQNNESEESNAILCYFLGENEEYWKQVLHFSREHNMEVRVIPVHPKDYYRPYKVLEGIGPTDFISEIAKAGIVLTDSYHATLFSTILHKNFYTFMRFTLEDPKSQNSRVTDFLNKFDLADHIWNKETNKSMRNQINWEETDKRLFLARQDSMGYLRNALEIATASDRNKDHPITNTCCGCGMCMKICPVNAISMEEEKGFYQSVRNVSLCMQCGLCETICPYNGEEGKDISTTDLFEAKSRNELTRKGSTSGGIAQELIECSLEENIPVYGCIYDSNDGMVKHVVTDDKNSFDIKKYQGSKYLQSRFFDNFHIFDEKKGLIIGTPCQIAATDNYLRLAQKRESFLLVEIICHGVPSLDVWKQYLIDKGIEKNQILDVKFRDSSKGWKKKYLSIILNEGYVSTSEKKDEFYNYFNLQSCQMKSCYECNYRTSSKADLRLGDYWGKKYTKDDLKNGVSMVLAVSDKGKDQFEKMNHRIEYHKKSIEDYYNGQDPHNIVIPTYYDALLRDLSTHKKSLRRLRKKHFQIYYINRQFQFIKAKVKRLVRFVK